MANSGTNSNQLRLEVIRPTLKQLEVAAGIPYSQAAENLLMGTAAQESGLGTYLAQLGGGPARGIFQMEPATLEDCYTNFLDYRAQMKSGVDSFLAAWPDKATQLVSNNAYAAAMCRVRYLRAPGNLPPADDIQALGEYWKQHYNTPQGAGTVDEFVTHYQLYVGTTN